MSIPMAFSKGILRIIIDRNIINISRIRLTKEPKKINFPILKFFLIPNPKITPITPDGKNIKKVFKGFMIKLSIIRDIRRDKVLIFQFHL